MRPLGGHLANRDGWEVRIRVDLPVRMAERHADGLPAVLEDEDVLDFVARSQLEGAVGPDGDEALDPLERGARQGRVVLRAVDDHLARAQRREDRRELGARDGGGRWVRPKGGKSVLEDRNLEVLPRDLRRRSSGSRGAQGTEVARRQEGTVLTVRRGDRPLAEHGVPAQLRHRLGRPLATRP
jgi:hypothetical protein